VSGGSYNYLCHKDSDQIFGRWDDLREMAARLDTVCPEAAAETRLFAEGKGTLLQAVEAHLERLKPLWHAVEWHDSGDWGNDQMIEAVRAYRKQGPGPTQVPEADQVRHISELVGQAANTLNEALNVALGGSLLGPRTEAFALDAFLAALWTSVRWREVTSRLTPEHREFWAAAIERHYSHIVGPGHKPGVDYWWREDATAEQSGAGS
jgi:hypothetical protein